MLPNWNIFRLHLVPVALLATASVWASGIPNGSPPVFGVSAQMVLVPITVTDHAGKTIEGLRANDFTIFDDRTPQLIASFSSEDAPCSVGLVLDISGSMRNALETARSVSHAFFKTSNDNDEFLLLTVSTQPDAEPQFTSDTQRLESTIDAAKSGGLTALFDTVYLGLTRMKSAQRPRRALLILSDGVDNHSRHSQRDLLHAALEADVQVYTILIDSVVGTSTAGFPSRSVMIQKPWEQSAAAQGPQALEHLSEQTGGLHFHVREEGRAAEAAARIGRALRNQYVLGYYPSAAPDGGKWHQVRVKSTVPKAYVSGRGGYYSR